MIENDNKNNNNDDTVKKCPSEHKTMLGCSRWQYGYNCSLSGQAAHATFSPLGGTSHLKRLFRTSVQKHTHRTATDSYGSSHYWKFFSLHKMPYIVRSTFTTFSCIALAKLSLATSKLLLHRRLIAGGVGSLKLTATTNLLFQLFDKWHNQYPNNWSVTGLIRVFSL